VTPTYTSTPGVFQFSVSSQPDANGQIHFNWGSTIRSDEVAIKIYTSGFRLVRAFDFDKHEHPEYLDAGLHEVVWDGKDEQGRMMPPETYLCFINIVAGKRTYEASGRTSFP
jgi:flagellar hook assembly protein FlgD